MKTPEEWRAVRLQRFQDAVAAADANGADYDLVAMAEMVEDGVYADVQTEALSAGKEACAAAERERCVTKLKLLARVHAQRPGHADRVLNDAIGLILTPTEDTHG